MILVVWVGLWLPNNATASQGGIWAVTDMTFRRAGCCSRGARTAQTASRSIPAGENGARCLSVRLAARRVVVCLRSPADRLYRRGVADSVDPVQPVVPGSWAGLVR